MELRHLRYFVTLAESLHFGQAAAKLQIAQPSLSHQIHQLEAELQTTLLRRTKRRVELTDAGQIFLEEAREILARSDRAAMVARRAGRGNAAKLRVGVGYCMDHVNATKIVGLRIFRDDDRIFVKLHAIEHGVAMNNDGSFRDDFAGHSSADFDAFDPDPPEKLHH